MSDQRIRKTLGRFVMPRIDFNEPDCLENAKQLITDYNVCGFIIFNGRMKEVKDTIAELNSFAEYPLLFGCDAERGLGQIVEDTTLFPFLMSHGAVNDPELLRKQVWITASEMRNCGLNLVFAPVLDINTNPDNPIINIRSFGDDKYLVTKLGLEFIKASRQYGIISCAKHFPGHGDCDVDSHVNMPVVVKDRDDIYENDIHPFREAVKNDLPMLMLAHVNYSDFDPDNIPATFSKNIINRLLKEKLGYEGVVISDSFRMGALSEFGTENEVALRSIKAGCHIILDPHNPVYLLEYLFDNYDKDAELREIADGIPKIISGIINFVSWETGGNAKLSEDEKKDVVTRICERSVCRMKGVTLCSKDTEIVILDIADIGVSAGTVFKRELEERGINISSFQYMNPGDTGSSLKQNDGISSTIILVFTSVRAWKEYSVIPDRFTSELNDYIKDKSEKILISFGSPYVAKYFEDVDLKLVSFDTLTQCQVAAAKVLTGVLDPGGTMPVNL